MIPLKQEIDIRYVLLVLAAFLGIIISLSSILGWKWEASMIAQAQAIRKESDRCYVPFNLYLLQVKMYDEKLDKIDKGIESIARKVGAPAQ